MRMPKAGTTVLAGRVNGRLTLGTMCPEYISFCTWYVANWINLDFDVALRV